MIVRTRNDDIGAHLWDTSDVLLDAISGNRFDTTHPRGTMSALADVFWPAAHGWIPLAVEPVSGHTLFVFAHPDHGIAATTMRASSPLRDQPTTHNEWETERRERLSDHVITAYHAHGTTRLDLLEAIGDTNGPVDNLARVKPGDRHFLDVLTTTNLLDCPAFMDDTTQMMVALGACRDLIDEARGHHQPAGAR